MNKEKCLEKAAQAWCAKETENIVMDARLASEFANILHRELENKKPEIESVEEAMKVLGKALANDDGYYMGWKANIAMAVFDEFGEDKLQGDLVHNAANRGAKRFIKLCFDVDHPVSDAG